MAKTVDTALQSTQQNDLVAQRMDPNTLAQSILGDETRLQQTQADQPGLSDTLVSVPGLVTALSAIAAAIGGKPEASAGLLTGFMEQANRNLAVDQQVKDKEIDRQSDQIQSKRNALNMVYQANPESFTDEEGKNTVNANLLGYALTGMPIAISPGSRLSIQRKTQAKVDAIAAAQRTFLSATDRSGRIAGLRQWNSAGGFGWTDETMDDIAGADNVEQMIINMMPYSSADTALDALVHVVREDIQSIDDPRLPDILANISERKINTGSTKIPEQWRTASEAIGQWVREDLTNRAQLNPLEQAEGALGVTHPELLVAYKQKYKDALYEGSAMTLEDYSSLYSSTMVKMLTASGFSPRLMDALQQNPQWLDEVLWNATQSSIIGKQQMQDEAEAGQFLALQDFAMQDVIGNVLGSVYTDLPDAFFDSVGAIVTEAAQMDAPVERKQAHIRSALDKLASGMNIKDPSAGK